jgi:hypothetical protein
LNQHRIAVVTRSLTSVPSRRDVLRGLVGAGLGLGAARLPAVVAAKKKRKKKVKPNAFGCLNVDAACKNADQCCSGICEGKKCRAHGIGTCDQKMPGACTNPDPELTGRSTTTSDVRQYSTGGGPCVCSNSMN